MYLIKQKPEEFIVKEVSNIKVNDKGDYIYFLLKKTNYNTIDAIKRIADALHIPSARFGFAGNKDRKAITEQLISIKGVKKENLNNLKLKDIEIQHIGYGDKYISLGELEGNKFTITIRNLNDHDIGNFKNKIEKKPILMPNYFGEQRFSEKNADIGRSIIKKEFEKASELLNLDIGGNDFIGALRKTDRKLLRLYVHAYQSLIFNNTINKYIRFKKDNEKIPIMGFGTELENYPAKLREIIQDILKKEDIDVREFITTKIPELSQEGNERDLFIEIKDLEILEEKDDVVKIKFFLQKGSYATEAVKFLFQM
ncbi:MAG: tRNA pseudouridine(13) synthase TruD [Nanoarchaeota archaeon]